MDGHKRGVTTRNNKFSKTTQFIHARELAMKLQEEGFETLIQQPDQSTQDMHGMTGMEDTNAQLIDMALNSQNATEPDASITFPTASVHE